MSYDIFIGNAVPVLPSEDNSNRFEWKVESVTLSNAPEWTSPPMDQDISGKSNGRHPGYVQFAEFCEATGLVDLFSVLITDHPGITPLEDAHLKTVVEARLCWQKQNIDAVPGWGDDEDPILARLIWYEFWMHWALSTQAHPAIENY